MMSFRPSLLLRKGFPGSVGKNFVLSSGTGNRIQSQDGSLVTLCRFSLFRRMYSTNRTSQLNLNPSKIGLAGILLLSVPVGTFCLGTWQVYRRQWKLNLLELLERKTKSEPVPLPDNLELLDEMEYQPVRVRGTFDHSKELLIGPRSLIVNGDADSTGGGLISSGGQSGYIVVTPLKLSDRNLTILVNRGWVPRNKTDPSTRKEGQVQGETELVGIVRLSEKRPPFVPSNQPSQKIFYTRDLESMGKILGAAPIMIEAVANSTVPGGPVGGQTRITLRNEHLSYIFTWYTLSLATSYMWYRRFIRGLPII